MIYVGTSQNHDSLQAGQEAARMAVEKLRDGEQASWALVFCGGRHDPEAVLCGIREKLKGTKIIGGAAVGTITNSSLSYTGFECALACFSSSLPEPVIVTVNDLDKGEIEAGRQLGAKLRDAANDGDTVLLFYDSVRYGPPPVLNVGSLLLEGIYAGLAGKELSLVGAGMVGDLQLTKSFVFDGRKVSRQAAVAVALPSVLRSHTTIMHGCLPVSSFMEITKISGPVVYELDGRPAAEVLREIIGEGHGREDNLSLTLTLGKKHGDPYAPYDESAYVNRLIMATNPKDGSVTLFEADFKEGTKIQIMSRDNQAMIESVGKQAKRLLESIKPARPVFGLYIDCAGRTCAFSGAEVEEAGILQAELGQKIPVLGFYSGVEIAPLLGQSRPLDWTGVLTLFTLEDA